MPPRQDPPERFGRFRILRKLGEGGMGAVYLAEDTLLARQVALKVPHFTAEDGPDVVQRFYREAKMAAGIDHPHICPVLDVGEVGGTHYLVMPHVEGDTLALLLARAGPMPPHRAAELTATLARAVEVLHQRGVVHRDLKPGNIMLRSSGAPMLMDFGLARSFTSSNRLTATGTPIGTPAYMSPEQVGGQADAIGPGADVYSLGVILYELVTGRQPFAGDLMTVFAQILHGTAAPPSQVRPGVDGRVDALCAKAMAKKPEERFAGMAAFAAALEEFARQAGASARPTPQPDRPPPPPAKPRAAVATAPAPPPRPARGSATTPTLGHGPGQPTVEDQRVRCPSCGAVVKVAAARVGPPLPCPRCRAPLDAAAPPVIATPPPRPALPRKQKAPSRLPLLLGGLVALLAAVAVVVAIRTGAFSRDDDEGTAGGGGLTTEELVSGSKPSIALVRGVPNFGTGFLARPNLLLTSYSAVGHELAGRVQIEFLGGGGARLTATGTLLLEDRLRDLAVFRVRVDRPALPLAEDYRLRPGESVTVIANASAGVTLESAVAQGLMSTEAVLDGLPFYQIAAPINPGSSGGPVLDGRGRVVGMVTRKAVGDKQESLSFAVPVADLLAALDRVGRQADADEERAALEHDAVTAARRLGRVALLRAVRIRACADAVAETVKGGGTLQQGLDAGAKKLSDKHRDEERLADARLREVEAVLPTLESSDRLPEDLRTALKRLGETARQMQGLIEAPQSADHFTAKTEELIVSFGEHVQTLQALTNVKGLDGR